MMTQPSRFTHASRQSAQDGAGPGCGDIAPQQLMLLVPVKRAGDVIYGARYAKRLLEWGIKVKVNLLHVTQAPQNAPIDQPRRHDNALEAQAEEMMREAGLYLSRSHIEFATFIFSGEVVFSILDTAELLACQEIVLPAARNGVWPRLFSGDLARKLARASRSATVLLADPDGMSCPAQVS
ncbi:universal stress protein [Janthinobacterium agaricidamnosum]|uniref:UspA domain-containing protein n=1 Tax=Janthinobacterium agaricidamnosum NBRC 102515 = DSM 9628 TaxID=1349767 RepID=W0UYH7_9BURK|nr:universal stress protein [Janthinobacterium agaricidamnosum]CDG81609.1 hypothetical protein GJA_953 [Janthinobacterium agaricidamnosum NBRC 102515 = DSM 9628]